ncbi:MAG: hypothetical protein WC022_01690 [Parcubacteria group bacterium]
MKLRNVNLSTLILMALLLSSFAFFVAAQESSITTNNILLDSDQDGLTDAEEKLYGTDPRKPDTDGDSYSDGAEVRAGYDPLKPAPGDKLTGNTGPDVTKNNSTVTAEPSANMTAQLAQKISGLAKKTDPNNPQTSSDEIQKIVNDALDSKDTSVTLPQIDPATIHTKKQNYSKSTAEEKKKEDFFDYITSVIYIFTSNSSVPITSASDITSAASQTAQQILYSLSSQDPTALNNLSTSGEAILGQLQEMEVPEDLVDLHIKAMQYATYAKDLKDSIKANPNDPMANIVNYSKIGAFIQSLSSFASDAQGELDKYDVSYDDIQARAKSMGIDLPSIDALNDLSTSVSKSSKTGSTTATDEEN